MAIQVNIHGNNNGTIAETVVINNYSQQPSYPQPQAQDIEDVVPVSTEQETKVFTNSFTKTFKSSFTIIFVTLEAWISLPSESFP